MAFRGIYNAQWRQRETATYKRPDGALGHKVFRKPTHTNLYLNPGSHHHPSNIQGVLSTLVHRTRAFCDQESLHDAMDFLKTTFSENGYSIKRYD